MSVRLRLRAPVRGAALRYLVRRVLIIAVLLAFVTPALPSAVQPGVRADVRAGSSVYLPILTQQYYSTNPLNVQVVLDPGHSMAKVVPPAGGTLSVTAANGARLTLALPEGALWVTQTVTMTVVSSLLGLPLSGGVPAAVDLQPSGLQLIKPATLTIEPATPVPADSQIIIAYDEDGKDVRPHPFLWDRANPARIATLVSHFSGYGLGSGTLGEQQVLLSYPPAGRYQQIAAQLAELIRKERAAQLANQPGDPQFWQKFEALFRQAYNEVIQPTLQAAFLTGCRGLQGQGAIDDALSLAMDWDHWVQVNGLDPAFTAESQDITNALLGALQLCWLDATQPCLDWYNPSQLQRVFAIAHEAALWNLPEEMFDPWKVKKCTGCGWVKAVSDWEGSVSYSYQGNSSRGLDGDGTRAAKENISASMRFKMAHGALIGGEETWDGAATGGSGSIDENVIDTYLHGSFTQTWAGGGALITKGYVHSYAKMQIDASTCRYTAAFDPVLMSVYTIDGEAEPAERDDIATAYLVDLPAPDKPGRELSGSASLPVEGPRATVGEYTHLTVHSAAASEIEYVKGEGGMGSAPVSWKLAPAWFWGKP